MARFSERITLRELSHEVDDAGCVRSNAEDTTVFFNRFSTSLQNRLAGAADGLKGIVEGQVRSCDYEGQQVALIGGRRYTVADAADTGEFTRLTLAERLSDE